MGSVTCERCGFVSFATSEVCKQCGGPLPGPAALNWRPQPSNWQPQGSPDWQQQEQAYADNWPPPAQGWPPPPHGSSGYYRSQPGYHPADDGKPKRKGVAVVSMFCGLLALPVMIAGALAAISLGAPAAILGSVAGLVLTILALALGIAATVRVNKNPAEFGGKGMAVAGIVLGCLLLVSVVPVGVIASIAIPNLLAARRASNEAAAIGTLRRIASAQATYLSTAGDEGYASLEELVSNDLVERQLAAGTKHGYRFEVEAAGDSFVATATPVEYPNSGTRSFYVAEDGVVRGADKRGGAADENDPPLASDSFAGPMSPAGSEDVEWTEGEPVIRRTSTQSGDRR
jgi:type IV pilus assembly protein PilA